MIQIKPNRLVYETFEHVDQQTEDVDHPAETKKLEDYPAALQAVHRDQVKQAKEHFRKKLDSPNAGVVRAASKALAVLRSDKDLVQEVEGYLSPEKKLRFINKYDLIFKVHEEKKECRLALDQFEINIDKAKADFMRKVAKVIEDIHQNEKYKSLTTKERTEIDTLLEQTMKEYESFFETQREQYKKIEANSGETSDDVAISLAKLRDGVKLFAPDSSNTVAQTELSVRFYAQLESVLRYRKAETQQSTLSEIKRDGDAAKITLSNLVKDRTIPAERSREAKQRIQMLISNAEAIIKDYSGREDTPTEKEAARKYRATVLCELKDNIWEVFMWTKTGVERKKRMQPTLERLKARLKVAKIPRLVAFEKQPEVKKDDPTLAAYKGKEIKPDPSKPHYLMSDAGFILVALKGRPIIIDSPDSLVVTYEDGKKEKYARARISPTGPSGLFPFESLDLSA